MQLALAIQIAREIALLAPQGVDLVSHVVGLLKASDEPEAQAALAKLKEAYEQSSDVADAALDDRLRALSKP